MTGEERVEAARRYLAKRKRARRIEAWDFCRRWGIDYQKAQELIYRRQLQLGEITMRDLTPDMRRRVIDPAALDLNAIANGPIMDGNEIYLPAGKLSMAETLAREAAAMLDPPSNLERAG